MNKEQKKTVEALAKRLREAKRDSRDTRLIENKCQRDTINAEYEAYLDGLEDMAKAVANCPDAAWEAQAEREVAAEPKRIPMLQTRWDSMKQMNDGSAAGMIRRLVDEYPWCGGNDCPKGRDCTRCIAKWLLEPLEVT